MGAMRPEARIRCCKADDLQCGINDALAILDSIDEGELLSALPEHAEDRRRHQAAITLLTILEERLRRMVAG